MSPWSSGDSLSPSILNLRQGSATVPTGFSTNTLRAESGSTLQLLSDFSVGRGSIATVLEIGGAPSNTSGLLSLRANSLQSDYLFLQDASGIKSNFLLGSRTGDGSSADGLNLYDTSHTTLLVRFSSDSIKFFKPVVGPVFDSGGALASTYNAALYAIGQSKESQIQAAITAAGVDQIARVYIPASLYPFDARKISFDTRVQMVREGGNPGYDVVAYGANSDGVTSNVSAFQAAFNALPTGNAASVGAGGTVWVPNPNRAFGGTAGYKFTSTVTIPSGTHLHGDSMAGTQLIGFAGILFAIDASTAAQRYITISDLMLNGGVSSGNTALKLIAGANGVQSVVLRNVYMDGWDTNLYTTQAGAGSFLIGIYSSRFVSTRINTYNFANNTNSVTVENTDHISTITGHVTIAPASSGLGWCFNGCVFEGYHQLDLGGVNAVAFNGCDFESNFTNDHYIGCGLVGAHEIGVSVKGCTFAGNMTTSYVLLNNCENVDLRGNTWASAQRWLIQSVGAGVQNVTYESAVTTLTDAATVATNVALGAVGQVTVGGNRTIGLPTNPSSGYRFTWTIIQDGTGGRNVSWHTIFKQAWSDAGNTANKRSSIEFIYDGTNWVQAAAQTPYV